MRIISGRASTEKRWSLRISDVTVLAAQRGDLCRFEELGVITNRMVEGGTRSQHSQFESLIDRFSVGVDVRTGIVDDSKRAEIFVGSRDFKRLPSDVREILTK